MKIRIISVIVIILAALGMGALMIPAQEITGHIVNGDTPKLAIPDFRGSGDAQQFMNVFNQTVWDQLAGSGVLKMVAKSYYPLDVPQQPSDFKAPTVLSPARAGAPARTQSNGPWLTDWSNAPVNANDLAFGYTAVQNGQLSLRGWLYNLSQSDPRARS